MVIGDRNRLPVRGTDLLTLLRSEGSAGWFAWERAAVGAPSPPCLLYTSDAADEL